MLRANAEAKKSSIQSEAKPAKLLEQLAMAKDSRQKVEQYRESTDCGNKSPATIYEASKESSR